MTTLNPEIDTKTRLINAMQQALRTTGYRGTGITEILEAAGAPKGVLYHHFPQGKASLAAAAITQTVERMNHELALIFASKAPLLGLEKLLHNSIQKVVDSDFKGGCPMASATLDATTAEPELQLAVKQGFERWQITIADGLVALGLPGARASLFASLILAAYEGAMLIARAHREPELIEHTASAVLSFIKAELPNKIQANQI